jgi:PKD domain
MKTERAMAANRIVSGVGLLAVVVGVACSDDGPTQPTEQFGPVRSLTLSVTPDRLPAAGPVTIELRATTDAGMRVAPDAVRLVLVINGRETVDPAELDDAGQFTQRLYLATSTLVRATSGSIVVERTVSVEATTGGVPTPVPPAPMPPPPSPVPSPGRPPAPAVSVTLEAAPPTGTTATSFTFTATATPINGAGPVTSYDWDEDGDGTFELLARPNPHNVLFSTIGSKIVTVRANSSTAGVSGTASAVVTVIPVTPFTVELHATPACVTLGQPIAFTATSAGGTGRPLVHDWDFEGDTSFDPPSTASNTVVHTYETPGARTARVRVTTTASEQAIADRAVLVVPLFGVCPP